MQEQGQAQVVAGRPELAGLAEEEEEEEVEEAEETEGSEILFLSFLLQLLVDVCLRDASFDSGCVLGHFSFEPVVSGSHCAGAHASVHGGSWKNFTQLPQTSGSHLFCAWEEYVFWIGAWLQENASYSARLVRCWIQFMRQSRRLLPARAVRRKNGHYFFGPLVSGTHLLSMRCLRSTRCWIFLEMPPENVSLFVVCLVRHWI